MNILCTINKNYLSIFITMLKSLSYNNHSSHLDVYVVANDIEEKELNAYLYLFKNVTFHLIHFKDEILDTSKTSKRYPSVIYYRLVAAKFLPTSLDRILYLDPDIIVLKDLSSLYHSDFDGAYYIGATNVKEVLRKFNESKNHAPKNAPYLNTGVLLINLNALRPLNQSQEIYEYIQKRKNFLTLPDQDILQGLYGDKTKLIDHLLYNLSDRNILKYNLTHLNSKIDIKWVEENCYIIHYFGKNKPWKKNYKGILQDFYLNFAKEEN